MQILNKEEDNEYLRIARKYGFLWDFSQDLTTSTIKIQMELIPKESVLDFCRTLLKEGVNPETRLEVYRGEKTEPDLICPSVGEGSKWVVDEDARRFRKYKPSPYSRVPRNSDA